jgi:hypothetical protein
MLALTRKRCQRPESGPTPACAGTGLRNHHPSSAQVNGQIQTSY